MQQMLFQRIEIGRINFIFGEIKPKIPFKKENIFPIVFKSNDVIQ